MVPTEPFLAVVNHLALRVLVGTLEVSEFDQVVKSLISATDDEQLQAELVQVKLLLKRALANAG